MLFMKNMTAPFFCMTLFLFFFQEKNYAQQERLQLPLDEAIVFSNKGVSDAKLFQVIDVTGDSVLGYTQTKEHDNNRVAIYAPVPKDEWIAALLDVKNVHEALKAGCSYLLLLQDVSVGVNEHGAYVRVSGILYESPIGKDAYVHYKTIENVSINTSAELKSAGNNLADLVKKEVAASGKIEKKLDLVAHTKAEIVKVYNDRLSFVNKEVFPTGIYLNFEEFKALKPSYPQFFIKVDTVSKSVSLSGFLSGDTTFHAAENAFAVAVANELYIYKNNRLYPAEAKGNTLVLSKYVDQDTRKNNASFWRMNVGDLISNEYRNPFDNVYTITINDYKGVIVNGEAVKVNVENGNLEL